MSMKLKAVLGALLTFAMSIITFQSISFAEATGVAKTQPPPETNVEINGVFNPNHQYLEDGLSFIYPNGHGEVTIGASTIGKGYIELLGVSLILQRWTGSTWVNYYSILPYVDTDINEVEMKQDLTVEEGYYYRVISTHWAEEGSLREQGVRTGNSVLVN